jgi:hypothetical protein
MEEAEDHVGDLHTRIVDVILHFDAAARVAQQTRESVAQDCVANVADVRGFVRVDAGVLDNGLGGVRGGRGGFVSRFFACGAKKVGAVEKEIQVASAGHFDARDPWDRASANSQSPAPARAAPFSSAWRVRSTAGRLLRPWPASAGARGRRAHPLCSAHECGASALCGCGFRRSYTRASSRETGESADVRGSAAKKSRRAKCEFLAI